MLPMNPKEFEKWTEVRKQGRNRYSFVTAFIATNAIFLLHFIVNAYRHMAEIDKYIAYNSGIVDTIILALLITFTVLFIAARILFHVNEKRYNASNGQGK